MPSRADSTGQIFFIALRQLKGGMVSSRRWCNLTKKAEYLHNEVRRIGKEPLVACSSGDAELSSSHAMDEYGSVPAIERWRQQQMQPLNHLA